MYNSRADLEKAFAGKNDQQLEQVQKDKFKEQDAHLDAIYDQTKNLKGLA